MSMYYMTYSSSNSFFLPFNNISISVNNSNSIPVLFKHAYHANPESDKKWAGSSSYVLIDSFQKPLDTSGSNNALL